MEVLLLLDIWSIRCLDCCKSYLSYPAFYTHCKTKHESKWPAYYNTPRPLDEIKRDRGRPRVILFYNLLLSDQSGWIEITWERGSNLRVFR
jgi:hypothetical protein